MMGPQGRVRLWFVLGAQGAARTGVLPTAGEVIYPPRGTHGPLVQQAHQIVVLHRGALLLEVDGRPLEVRPDEMVLLVPGQRVKLAP